MIAPSQDDHLSTSRYLFAAQTTAAFAVGPSALDEPLPDGTYVAFESNNTASTLQVFGDSHPIKLGVVGKCE